MLGILAVSALALLQANTSAFSPEQRVLADQTVAAARAALPRVIPDYARAKFRATHANYEEELNAVRLCGQVNVTGGENDWRAFVAFPDGQILVFDPALKPPEDTLNYLVNIVCDGQTAQIDPEDYSGRLTASPQ